MKTIGFIKRAFTVFAIAMCANTASAEGKFINKKEYVDLGLPSGTLWAACNVGAQKPEDRGFYYSWGTTRVCECFEVSHCLTMDEDIKRLQDFKIIDKTNNLTNKYDSASDAWGKKWKTPSQKQMEELQKECKWEWTSSNGVPGYKVTGPNGSHIFFPSAGYRISSRTYNKHTEGHYWTSTAENDSKNAITLKLDSTQVVQTPSKRFHGLMIRPVAR